MSAYPQIVFRRDQCCQRKMQPNYPSVAKPCTSESSSGRPHFPAIGNKKRTKPRKVTALKDVSEAGLAGSGPSRGVLPRSHPALAPKVLPWGEDGGVACAPIKDMAKGQNCRGFRWPFRSLCAAATIKARNSWSLPLP